MLGLPQVAGFMLSQLSPEYGWNVQEAALFVVDAVGGDLARDGTHVGDFVAFITGEWEWWWLWLLLLWW